MELSFALRRRRPEVDLIEAHSGLAGLFVGEGVVDGELVQALLERSWATDEILLAIADGRRAEARHQYGAAFERFEEAIGAAHVTGAVELVAHARFDAARVLLKRAEPGDLDRARALLDGARAMAGARRMDPLLARIGQLVELAA